MKVAGACCALQSCGARSPGGAGAAAAAALSQPPLAPHSSDVTAAIAKLFPLSDSQSDEIRAIRRAGREKEAEQC